MEVPLPPLDVNAELVPFAVVAVAMVAVTVLVLGLVRPSDGRPPLVTQLLLAASVIAGGSLLLVSLLFVFLDPNGTTAWTWVLLAFNFMMMVPVGLWFVGHIIFQDRRIAEASWRWPVGIGVAVTGSEVLMGLLFAIGGSGPALGPGEAFSLGLSSVWLFWSMAAVMAPLVAWAPLSRIGRAGGWGLVVATLVAPWVRPYPLIGAAGMAAVMVVVFVAFLRPLWAGAVVATEGRLLVALSGAFLAMAVSGSAVGVTDASEVAVLAFGGTMAMVMVAEVSYLLGRTYAPAATTVAQPAPTSRVSEPAAGRPGPVGGP